MTRKGVLSLLPSRRVPVSRSSGASGTVWPPGFHLLLHRTVRHGASLSGHLGTLFPHFS